VESTIRSSIVEGECTCGEYGDVDCDDVVNSSGYNIESLGDSCGLNHETDKVSVSAVELKLEPLENGTHALGDGSVAIDVIPRAECDVETDQRGEPRPETGGSMCDVGAFEVQP
jgi:hypothetical protein